MAVCSDGLVFKNPKSTKKYERKLAKQRSLPKKKKGSGNYRKQRLNVAKIHEKIACWRADFTHKMTGN
ncbi:transposase [Vibrio sp. PNB22_3_1]